MAERKKMRLNVVALDKRQAELGRTLHVVSAKLPLPELQKKIEKQLIKDGHLQGGTARLLNHTRALLPIDELTGTILRDGETVYAVCGADEAPAPAPRSGAPPAPEPARLTRAEQERRQERMLLRPGFAKGGEELLVEDKDLFAVSSESEGEIQDSEEEPDDDGPAVPGPREVMEPSAGERGKLARPAKRRAHSATNRASEAAHQIKGRADWSVEHLTPRLREFIWARFQEAGLERGAQKLPKHDDRHITVLMKPHPRLGAEQPTAPVQYSVARVDLAEFESLARKQVSQARLQMGYLEKCRTGLDGLRKKGHQPTEVCKTLLPFKWRDEQEHAALLQEAVGHTFNCVENFRPVLVLDTANIHGEQLIYVQAALKRLLYGFIAGKSLFNFVYFPNSAKGLARTWATGMVPPAASSLREAEEFLETVEPAHRVNLLDGLKTALCLECDAIYLLSSGYDRRYDPNFLLQAVRSLNLREVSIWTIGIDVNSEQDEVFLRRLAESNHGDYKAKALVQQATANLGATAPVRKVSTTRTAKTTKMTIGSQAKIVEVIYEEHKRHEALWLEEQKCANRLLLASATQGAVPRPADARAVSAKLLTNRNRLGGGYVFLEENMRETPLRECYDAALRGRNADEPVLWSGEGPERHGLARKSMPVDPSVYNVRPGLRPEPVTTVTSLRVDTATLPPPQIKKPSLANPWERVEGGTQRIGPEQARLVGQAEDRARGAGAARPGAPPRRSEENRARTEQSIAARRTAAAQHVAKPRKPLENEVPEAWNLERRWSWG